MGRMREFTEEETATASLSEALLFTTMCIIGLPVEVLIKDGSIYSGIFHTASVDKGYGIALKKAKIIKKGTHNANVSDSGLIDTLVVLPGDLVQVVAKGVMLPADHSSSCATCDNEGAVSGYTDNSRGSENGIVHTDELCNQERQARGAMPLAEEDGYHHHTDILNEVPEVNGSSTSLNESPKKLNVLKEDHKLLESNFLANGSLSAIDASVAVKHVNQLHDKKFTSAESVASEFSGSAKTELDVSRNPKALPVELAPQNSHANRTAKESKLNPSAKVFSPSFPNFRSTPPLVQTAPTVAYVPNSIPTVQVAGAQPDVGIRPIVPCSSWPVKFVPYSTATNADNGLQYSQPQFAGHIVTRAQPIRHGAQYQPIQAVPPYVHHNPQNGIFGRPGQLLYVHPVTHDVVQAPAAFSQAPHPLLASHPIHVGIAKNEVAGLLSGQALPVSVTPPLVANGQQPFTMPSHIQLSQPLISSMRPVPILGPNIPYSAKFP